MVIKQIKSVEPVVPGMSNTLDIDGMTCTGCTRVVESVLSEVEDVTDVDVDLDGEVATVEGDADPDALVAAVEDAGYGATPHA